MELDPKALAQIYFDDNRPGVQTVDDGMICDYVMSTGMLTLLPSAHAFAIWLDTCWFDFVPGRDAKLTNGDVIKGALESWRN